jgi:hypothetical protein
VLIKDESGKVQFRKGGKPVVALDEYLDIGGDLPFKMSEGMMRDHGGKARFHIRWPRK